MNFSSTTSKSTSYGFLSLRLSSCHSSIKARLVVCTTNTFPVRFSNLSCGSLLLPQSYHGPLGYFSDNCSSCLTCLQLDPWPVFLGSHNVVCSLMFSGAFNKQLTV
ncbi:hypothetical protein CHARACLAT_007723 [Characodon lateralis]|uniref:Uncharacterized protein n=1 Tax=Characodon lateralis TaxID=208331 RepID=A0ABU7DPD2_9TELE|nr:hypothetical protein [Characodon lateralis]